MTGHYISVLALKQLRVRIHLGVGDEERSTPQEVAVNVRFYMPQPPAASHSDNGEYICYHSIAEKIHSVCMEKPYRLIEFLVHEIYRLLRAEVPAEVKLWVQLHKLGILLPYVQDGTSYTFTDLPPSAWIVPE